MTHVPTPLRRRALKHALTAILLLGIVAGFLTLAACDPSGCDQNEALARMTDAIAQLQEREVQEGPTDELIRQMGRLNAAMGRMTAALMRGDVDEACKISDRFANHRQMK